MLKIFESDFLPESTLLRIGIGGVLLASIPLFLHAGFAEYPHFHALLERLLELSSKLGDALLIAWILIVAVDEDSRIKLIESVVRAASPRLIGRHLPQDVQNSVLNYFKIDFFRPILRVEYEIEMLPSQEDAQYVKVISRTKGTVRNCGTMSQAFRFYGSGDPPVLPNLPSFQISLARIEREQDGTTLFTSELPRDSFNEDVILEPDTSYVTTLETVEYRPTSYFSPMYIGSTVVRSSFSVKYPKELLDVSLEISTISAQDPVPQPTYFGSEWDIREPILPGQCLLLTWSPKAKTV